MQADGYIEVARYDARVEEIENAIKQASPLLTWHVYRWGERDAIEQRSLDDKPTFLIKGSATIGGEQFHSAMYLVSPMIDGYQDWPKRIASMIGSAIGRAAGEYQARGESDAS